MIKPANITDCFCSMSFGVSGFAWICNDSVLMCLASGAIPDLTDVAGLLVPADVLLCCFCGFDKKHSALQSIPLSFSTG